MAREPRYEYDMPRLYAAWLKSRMALQKSREWRREAAKQVAGNRYGDEDAKEDVYIPLLGMYVDIVLGNLVANEPRVMLDTFDRRRKPMVDAQQAWANRQIVKIGLADTLKRWVVDAGYAVGVLHTALASPAEAAKRATTAEAGMPYVARVDLDDFGFDPHATDFAEAGFVFRRVRVPLDAVRDDSTYSGARKKLTPQGNGPYNRETGDERIVMISRGYRGTGYGDDDEYCEHVDLWQFWCPREKQILTFADEQLWGGLADGGRESDPLLAQAWVGPDQGPYDFLGLTLPIPGNAMPVGPLQRLMPMHLLVNRLYRKLARQAARQKQVGLYPGSDTEETARLTRASDGDVIQFEKPENIKVWSSPGADPNNAAFAENARTLYSWVAGNLDAAGGLAPQAKTLGQDRLLNEGASRAIAHMQRAVVAGTSNVQRKLAWYWHLHPTLVQRSAYNPPGLDDVWVDRAAVPVGHPLARYGAPPDRSGRRMHVHERDLPFDEIDVRVDPYSLPHQTPEEREAKLDQLVMQVIAPLMPLLQQKGIDFDVRKYLQKKGEYGNNTDIPELVTVGEPPAEAAAAAQGGGQPAEPGMPAQTTRTYERVNRSAVTGPGQSRSVQQALLGQNPGGAPSSNGKVATIGG